MFTERLQSNGSSTDPTESQPRDSHFASPLARRLLPSNEPQTFVLLLSARCLSRRCPAIDVTVLWEHQIRVAALELKHGGSEEKTWPSVHEFSFLSTVCRGVVIYDSGYSAWIFRSCYWSARSSHHYLNSAYRWADSRRGKFAELFTARDDVSVVRLEPCIKLLGIRL